ncbi:GAF domain-containing protein, partial [Peribacillus sp. NPDC060186]
MKDVVTRELEVTSQLNVRGFLGVTLKDLKGKVFGTLCVMDREERVFSEEDINYLKSCLLY